MTQSRNGKEKILSEKTPCQQLNDFAKVRDVKNPTFRVIDDETVWGTVTKEYMGKKQVSKVQIFIVIECEFMGETFRAEAGNRNSNTETKTSKKSIAKNQAAEKALDKFMEQDQVDTTRDNLDTGKKPQTPIAIAIQYNNISFISKCMIFSNN